MPVPNAQSQIATMLVAYDGKAVCIRDPSPEVRVPAGGTQHQPDPGVMRIVVGAEKRIATLLGLRSNFRIVHLQIGATSRVAAREGFQL